MATNSGVASLPLDPGRPLQPNRVQENFSFVVLQSPNDVTQKMPMPESSRKLRIIPAIIVRLFSVVCAHWLFSDRVAAIKWNTSSIGHFRVLTWQSSFSNLGKLENILCENDFDFSYQRLRAVPRFEKEERSNSIVSGLKTFLPKVVKTVGIFDKRLNRNYKEYRCYKLKVM